jgi:hypothetical protein
MVALRDGEAMSQESIRAEVWKTLNEGCAELYREANPFPDQTYLGITIPLNPNMPIILTPGSMLIVSVNDQGARIFMLYDQLALEQSADALAHGAQPDAS